MSAWPADVTLDWIKARCVVDAEDKSPCWIWKGAVWSQKNQLPKISRTVGDRKATFYLRPITFALHKGRAKSADTVLAMKCGNSRCLNAAHMREARTGSLAPRGRRPISHVVRATLARRKAGVYRLDMETARRIRARAMEGATLNQLAKEFNIHRTTAWKAATGRTWAEPSPFRL